MEHTTQKIGQKTVDIYSLNTVVVGSGAAGLNAADTLYTLGQTDIAILTNGFNRGTSRNTGSDKQTYYKLSLSGHCPDSVGAMAQDLFSGGCVDGDIALCEAALSAKCFLKLCAIGVDFPTNRYGEYVGYQTDHDTAGRATSVGPLTSRFMTVQLEQEIRKKHIRIFDGYQVIALLTNGDRIRGLLTYSPTALNPFAIFNCKNVIYATGGPAGMYALSVFPESQMGATGVALEAGVKGRNLTEWQFGLASLSPRWNVSGTYMQVLPRMVSIDNDGIQREFVQQYYQDDAKALSMIFKKGYQWPFDVRKIDGSSLLDLLVYRETVLLGRKVYLDFTKNPLDTPPCYDQLEREAAEYLRNANADFGTPVERLIHMNQPAYQLYLDKGVDLKTQLLEVAVCAQHNNGGLDVDLWWQSNIQGFFPCGEVAGNHGVFRPGGSALNAGQVGSTRAAQFIAQNRTGEPECVCSLLEQCSHQIEEKINLADAITGDHSNGMEKIHEARLRMTKAGGCVRNEGQIQQALEEIDHLLQHFSHEVHAHTAQGISDAYYLYDILLCQKGYLTAMLHFGKCGNSRGSALYSREEGTIPEGLPALFGYQLDEDGHTGVIQETIYDKNTGFTCSFRPVRPLPEGGGFFENVWKTYRDNKNIR